MSEDSKFFIMFGGIFFSVGMIALIVGVIVACLGGGILGGGIPILLGIIFGTIGGGFLLVQIKKSRAKKKLAAKGKRYTGKIYDYVEDKSFTMNGDFLVNIKVHYFDENYEEREILLDTRFVKGTNGFPIGATIDIIVDGNDCTWVPGSVRNEVISGEAELMDDKPVNPTMVHMVAVSCPRCGASFSAAQDYVAKCPYCGSAVNN